MGFLLQITPRRQRAFAKMVGELEEDKASFTFGQKLRLLGSFRAECFGRDIKVCRIEFVYLVPWAVLSKSDRSALQSVRFTHCNYRQFNIIQYNSKRVLIKCCRSF